MSTAKEKCQLNDCNRAASAFCYCCRKSICTRHFTEHIDGIRAQVDPLADAVNTMLEKIKNVTSEQLIDMPCGKLHQWRYDMHQAIDEVFSSKQKEIEDLVAKNQDKFLEHKTQQWENAMKIQEEVRQLAEDGDATFQQIESLKTRLATLEGNHSVFKRNFLSVDTQAFGHGSVTVSSALDQPRISKIIMPALPRRPKPVPTNVPNDPTFLASASQSAGLQVIHPINSSSSNASLAAVGSTAMGHGEHQPIPISEGSMGRRIVIKAKRRPA